MREDGFLCKRCGHCCTALDGGYCFTVDITMVEFWEEVAPHLVDWVEPLSSEPELELYDGWISPATGEPVERCPWLRMHKHQRYKNKGAHCLIHGFKHAVCEDYPLTILHALNTGCPGFDHLSEEASLMEARKAFILKLYCFLADKRFAEKYGNHQSNLIFT